MFAHREYAKVKDRRLSITLPEGFEWDDVEVIVMPKEAEDDLGFLSEAVRRGMQSPLSAESHEEVFNRLKARYGNPVQ